MKRIILTLAAAAALILVPVGTASATSSSATKVVSWKLADGSTFANRWAGGDQTLVVAPATCGKIQADTYKYDTPEHVKTVDDLIAGGKLGLVNGHPADSSVYISNTDTDLGPCSTPTPTPTPTPTETPAPTPTPTVTPTVTPTPTPTHTVPPAHHTTHQTTHHTAVKKLAYTGTTTAWILWPGIGLILLAGLMFLLRKRSTRV
jgi:LPXTG-motif cell wall-anchored protein